MTTCARIFFFNEDWYISLNSRNVHRAVTHRGNIRREMYPSVTAWRYITNLVGHCKHLVFIQFNQLNRSYVVRFNILSCALQDIDILLRVRDCLFWPVRILSYIEIRINALYCAVRIFSLTLINSCCLKSLLSICVETHWCIKSPGTAIWVWILTYVNHIVKCSVI